MHRHDTASVLILYTGGTIGMTANHRTGALENFGAERFRRHVPELDALTCHVDVRAFHPPIDSSDMEPAHWVQMARIIATARDAYDGFVVLHGTDTMAYTASALSFMLENIGKPVVITGSQLPIGQLRTDGKENLLTSIEIAAARDAEGRPRVPEVCIYFDSRLMRGNRTTKVNTEGFNAFRSFNHPSLAHAGVTIRYEDQLILRPAPDAPFRPHYGLDTRVLVLTLFPGIRADYVEHVLGLQGLRALVLKTYGAGNAPQKSWLVDSLRRLVEKGVIVVNITQCTRGAVEMRRYETGLQLLQAGVLNGYDSTIECCITKLMSLLGEGCAHDDIVRLLNTSLAGEVTLTPVPGPPAS